ncbi:MAG TPA: hypothetical protein VGD77_06470 [Gemmatimonadaceae bacterium]
MISVRVHLAFSSSSELRLERFSTLVSVPSDAYARGAHIEVALWRARVRGFVQPPVSVEVTSVVMVPEGSRPRGAIRRTRR